MSHDEFATRAMTHPADSPDTSCIPTGPIDREPLDYPPPGVMPSAIDRENILRDVFRTAGVGLGAYDDRIVQWLTQTADWSTFTVIASWVLRAAATQENGTDSREDSPR